MCGTACRTSMRIHPVPRSIECPLGLGRRQAGALSKLRQVLEGLRGSLLDSRHATAVFVGVAGALQLPQLGATLLEACVSGPGPSRRWVASSKQLGQAVQLAILRRHVHRWPQHQARASYCGKLVTSSRTACAPIGAELGQRRGLHHLEQDRRHRAARLCASGSKRVALTR